jgi:hypothetical protein
LDDEASQLKLDSLRVPSAEAEAIARGTMRQALLLGEHAVLASSRGDLDTTTRLLEAAATAEALATSRG